MRQIISAIQEHVPEPIKVFGAAGTYFGVSLADCKDIIQIVVGLATFAYILSKTVKIWTKKKRTE